MNRIGVCYSGNFLNGQTKDSSYFLWYRVTPTSLLEAKGEASSDYKRNREGLKDIERERERKEIIRKRERFDIKYKRGK